MRELRKHRVLICGAVGSIFLLAIFLVLQGVATNLLQLPTQWLWVALVPVLVCVVTGGYIQNIHKLKVGLFEVELPDPQHLESMLEVTPAADESQTQVAAPWQSQRAAEYKRTNGLCLVHVYRPSKQKGQVFDAFVYLVRHRKGSTRPIRSGFQDVKQVEFYLGESWGDQVFTVVNSGGNILGVRAHAFGTFLATCRVTFTDDKETGKTKDPEILHRYIDCEMLPEETA
jgi:hypothetical protein